MTSNDQNNINASLADISCPSCGATDCYQLSDDRKMCRKCRKKFTPQLKSFRLPDALKEKIAEYFWGMIPAEEGAKNLNLNRKTLQRYYRQLRREISLDSEKKHKLKTIEPPFSCLISLIMNQPTVFSETAFRQIESKQPAAVILNRDKGNEGRFKLDNLYIRKYGSNAVIESHDEQFRQIRLFWLFAVKRLAHYKVFTHNNLYYFLKEMEFRFNVDDEDDAIQFLTHSLSHLKTNY